MLKVGRLGRLFMSSSSEVMEGVMVEREEVELAGTSGSGESRDMETSFPTAVTLVVISLTVMPTLSSHYSGGG